MSFIPTTITNSGKAPYLFSESPTINIPSDNILVNTIHSQHIKHSLERLAEKRTFIIIAESSKANIDNLKDKPTRTDPNKQT